MCLLKVIEDHGYPEEGEGWKVLFFYKDIAVTPCRRCRLTFDTWLEAEDLRSDFSDEYWRGVGFHIYATREDAERLTRHGLFMTDPLHVVKVRYRGLVAAGLGDGGFHDDAKVLVAKQMFIPKPEQEALCDVSV